MKHRAIIMVLPYLLLLLLGCDSDNSLSNAKAKMKSIEISDTQIFDGGASNVATFRISLDTSPFVSELLKFGKDIASFASDRMAFAATPAGADVSDDSLAIYAYIIEKTNYKPATKNLEKYLYSNPGERHHFWAPYIVVRSLLVLKGLPDPSEGYKVYSDTDLFRALKKP